MPPGGVRRNVRPPGAERTRRAPAASSAAGDLPARRILAGIRLVVLDVDGVLSDGRIILDDRGTEYKAFDVHDGYGIRKAMAGGIRFAIISGRESKVVAHRARRLGIAEVRQGVEHKLPVFREIVSRLRLTASQACCIGDDEPDLPILRAAGLSAAPAGAVPAVRAAVHYVTRAAGGRGAVREVLDLILVNRGG